MIGIIGAMTIEVNGLKDIMTEKSEKTIGNTVFTQGRLSGSDVVVAVSGEGKVNAAMCAQAMIIGYSPAIIINSGVAGGLASNLKIGDIVIADASVQHDWDLTPLGEPLGKVSVINTIEIPCSEEVRQLLAECSAELGFTYKTGIIATGDQFISSDEKKKWLIETFNASACEMETGAIAQVCMRNGVPFGGIRAISDGGDDEAKMSFPEFAGLAVANSIKVLALFAKHCAEKNKTEYIKE